MIRFLAAWSLQNVVIETDALDVVNLWKDPGDSRSLITSIIQEVKELSGRFASFDITHVSRLANKAAHSTAHKAISDRRRCVWVNFTPPFLAKGL
jgi:hypothetical protein